MADVSFRDISKRYGAVTALEGLDLDIASGEFVSLLGPSGSGKSTTLGILSGLQDADSGSVAIGGRDITRVPPDKRDIALVFQNYALYPHMTVFENLAFPLEARRPRVPAATIEAKVRTIAETLGLGDLLHRYPKELSGGQQQRVALGRAMVRDPKVFLLDEPLSNLDARLRIRMRRDLKALHAELGSTIVYVTHDQAEAMSLSDRIAIFSKGRLQQCGTPDAIYNRPANLFVANFVGDRETNLMDGRVAESDGRVVVRGQGWDLPLARSPSRLGGDGAVTVGIRPEALSLAPAGSPGTIPGKVVQTELAGPDLYIFVAIPDGTEISLRCEPGSAVAAGAVVHIRADEAKVHLFDPTTERCVSNATTG